MNNNQLFLMIAAILEFSENQKVIVHFIWTCLKDVLSFSIGMCCEIKI